MKKKPRYTSSQKRKFPPLKIKWYLDSSRGSLIDQEKREVIYYKLRKI